MYQMKNNAKKDSEYRHHIQLKYPGACSQLDLEAVLLFATFPYGMGGPKTQPKEAMQYIKEAHHQTIVCTIGDAPIHDNKCNPSTMHHIFSWKTSFDTGIIT